MSKHTPCAEVLPSQSGEYAMWQEVVTALGLLLVVEGILPFLNPGTWRKVIYSVAQMDNRSVRIMGLVSMLIGVVLLQWIK